MENDGFFVQVKELMQEYIEDRLLLIKLQATEKAAKASASIVIALVIAFISLILFMILSFIAGYYLSKTVNSYPGGFGILAGIYIIIIFLLLYLHKKYTAKIISDKVVKFSLESKDTFTDEI